MSTTVDKQRSNAPGTGDRTVRASGAERAYMLLRTGFTVAPIAFGADKFVNWLTDWDRYLARPFDRLIPGNAHQAMLFIGVVEIAAGLVVAVRPRFGGYLVSAWLAGIVVDLIVKGGYGDIALRDVGLLVGALALAQLAGDHAPRADRSGPT
jgi:hypothetical protein